VNITVINTSTLNEDDEITSVKAFTKFNEKSGYPYGDDNILVVNHTRVNKKGNSKVVDIFYENGEYIKYFALEDINGEIINDEEEAFTEEQVIDYYISYNDKITEEFYDDGTEEIEEVIPSETTEEVSKAQMYKNLIQGYEFALEIETDEEKITMYKNLIEGYEFALELEN
jgi:hypothetical protein